MTREHTIAKQERRDVIDRVRGTLAMLTGYSVPRMLTEAMAANVIEPRGTELAEENHRPGALPRM